MRWMPARSRECAQRGNMRLPSMVTSAPHSYPGVCDMPTWFRKAPSQTPSLGQTTAKCCSCTDGQTMHANRTGAWHEVPDSRPLQHRECLHISGKPPSNKNGHTCLLGLWHSWRCLIFATCSTRCARKYCLSAAVAWKATWQDHTRKLSSSALLMACTQCTADC